MKSHDRSASPPKKKATTSTIASDLNLQTTTEGIPYHHRQLKNANSRIAMQEYENQLEHLGVVGIKRKRGSPAKISPAAPLSLATSTDGGDDSLKK